jgi:hypothetical protein
MILSFAEKLTDTVVLDSELTAAPDSKMYFNSGVHPSITTQNLLSYLPNVDFTFADYVPGDTYGKFTDSRNRTDLVTSGGLIYQSLSASNTGNDPASFPLKWLETNIESLRIKTFALSSQDNAISELNLQDRLVDSQYLYNVAEIEENATATLLPNDYAAWVFEPKGSDYVEFTINEVAFQATTAVPQNLYVINQGVLIDTLILNPNAEGRLVFEDIDYVFSGKGKFIFAVDAQTVLTNGATIDPLKYKGFVVYTATGIGATPEGADYSISTTNNGLGFNISVNLDSTIYLNKNLKYYGQFLQATWELDVLNMFLHNSHNRSNREQRIQLDVKMLQAETKDDKSGGSILSKFKSEKRKALAKIKTTFDNQLVDKNKGGQTTLRSV